MAQVEEELMSVVIDDVGYMIVDRVTGSEKILREYLDT